MADRFDQLCPLLLDYALAMMPQSGVDMDCAG
jgi:hypothetical protein